MKAKDIIIIILILFAIIVLIKTKSDFSDVSNINQELIERIKQEEQFRDSIMTAIKDIEIKPVQEIKNYYTNKYEEKFSVIELNDIDSDIIFFSDWYTSKTCL
jgi:hypothetical protein